MRASSADLASGPEIRMTATPACPTGPDESANTVSSAVELAACIDAAVRREREVLKLLVRESCTPQPLQTASARGSMKLAARCIWNIRMPKSTRATIVFQANRLSSRF
jgi:hypothetical protein